MVQDLIKPLPVPTPVTRPFWDGLKEEKVLLQRCLDCSTWIFYPRSHCPRCLSSNLEWQQVTGEGTLYTYTIARQATAPHFVDEVPQYLAMIELDEGVRLTSTLLADPSTPPKVGARVKPIFDHVNEDVTMLRYQVDG